MNLCLLKFNDLGRKLSSSKNSKNSKLSVFFFSNFLSAHLLILTVLTQLLTRCKLFSRQPPRSKSIFPTRSGSISLTRPPKWNNLVTTPCGVSADISTNQDARDNLPSKFDVYLLRRFKAAQLFI